MEIKRYPTKIMLCSKRSVAEHSWFVSQIANGLAIWESQKFKLEKADVQKVLFMAINHDIIEAYTGDIISTTKNLSPVFKEELVNIEGKIFREHLTNTIPASWGKMYVEMHEELTELKTIEARIVKAADLIDRIFECMDEISLGNKKEFEDIIVNDIKKMMKLDLISVEYFLKYSIKDVEGAYEYIPEDIKEYLENKDFSMYF